MQQITAAMNCLDGPAKAWFLRQYDVATWAEFREELELEFGDDVSTAVVVLNMHQRKKRADETPREYVQVMHNLGDQADLGERVIIRFIAEGLTEDEQLIRELRSATNFRRLREKIHIWDSVIVLKRPKERGATNVLSLGT